LARYQFVSYHPVSRALLHPSLRLINPEWSWVVGGNGTLTAKIAVPENLYQIEALRVATAPKQSAVYVRNSAGQFPWGGPIISRSWNPDDSTISITAMQWRAWVYNVPLIPETDMSQDVHYVWTDVDQTQIGRDIVGLVSAGGSADGSPPVLMGSEGLSGKVRDLSVWGTAFKSAGALIDSFANRDGGLEWDLEVRQHVTDGFPQLYYVTYFPQRGGLVGGMMLKRTTEGGNIAGSGSIEENAAGKVERFWATGVGTAPDQLFAQDTDPELANGNTLRFEGNTNYNNVEVRSTLASHARASRKFFAPTVNLVTVETALSQPDVDSYGIGDRTRYFTRDRWESVDVPAARIVEKKVSLAGAGKVTITLDLTDFELPEVDAGGAV
jgi:hypothetical protein